MAIEARYMDATPFIGGRAIVRVDNSWIMGDDYLVINEEGETVEEIDWKAAAIRGLPSAAKEFEEAIARGLRRL